MASLFQRSNGYYYLVTSVNGRRVWESTGSKTKSEALQYISDKKRKSKKTGTITLSQFRTQFLAYAESNLSRSTVELYKSAFSKFIHLVGDLFDTPIYSSERGAIQTAPVEGSISG